jgi:outer membrane biogenesis lipoprotein LolB
MIPDFRSLGLLLALLVLAGCATTRQSVDLPVLDTWETRNEALAKLRDWEFKGRIAVKAGDDGFNGKFNWTQRDEAFRTGAALALWLDDSGE